MNRRRRSSLPRARRTRCSRRSSIALSAMPEAADLGARVGRLDAVREVAAGDRAGGVAHAVERQQADAHDAQAASAERQQHAGDDEPLDEQQAVQRLVDLAQRDRGDGGDAAVRVVLGETR